MKRIYLIGAGGVGSFLAPVLCKLVNASNVTIIDGDTLEKKNLDRQLFSENDIGKSKAEALGNLYGCEYRSEFYSHGQFEVDDTDWMLVAVDNNPARNAVLQTCDAFGSKAIFGANEVTSAEAYYYEPDWRGSPLDPRQYYKEIETDTTLDPRNAAIGCTGEAQANNRQLVTANYMAGALMSHLYVCWGIEAKKLDAKARSYLPYQLKQHLSTNQHFRVIDVMKGEDK